MNVSYILSRKADGTIVISHPVQDTNLYVLNGSLQITFEVKTTGNSYVYIKGSAQAEEKSEKLITYTTYAVNSIGLCVNSAGINNFWFLFLSLLIKFLTRLNSSGENNE